MFIKDFASKMEKIGLLVISENHKGKSSVTVFSEDIKKHIVHMSDNDSSYLKIYNNVFDLDNPNYIIDIKNDYINDTSNKTIYMTDLGTDLSTIPKLKELESKQVPEILTRHLKRISN